MRKVQNGIVSLSLFSLPMGEAPMPERDLIGRFLTGIGEANPMGLQAYMSAAMDHAAQAHAAIAAQAAEGGPKVDVAPRIAEDVGASVGILQTAKELGIDLIVVGSHGRSGIARLMLGSVASRVVAESTVPVLVAR